MRYGGFVNKTHDASISIINSNGDIEFASGSERYTKRKHESILDKELVSKLLEVDCRVYFQDYDIDFMADMSYDHHKSHAASSFYTRPWDSWKDTVMLSIDGAGKDTYTSNNIYVYDKENNDFINLYSDLKSIGAVYTAITKHIGFGSLEAGITMGLSSFGTPIYTNNVLELMQEDWHTFFKNEITNMEYYKDLFKRYKSLSKFVDTNSETWKEDLAASVQEAAEIRILEYAKMARKYGSKLCYAGGVAQNIIANSKIKDLFDDMWIVSDPTDGGGSLGAAAWAYTSDYGGTHINWIDTYLGHDIQKEVNPKEVVDYILKHKVCGIANGKAEFGPRALGNRSLIGDVRYDIKDTVNRIKKRQNFRPFGPVILEEEFDKWFEGHTNGYMQYVCKPKHDLQSVIHVDGTSRVQTVPSHSRSIIRPILEEYYERTGVPMLLNTSLNIKGEAMVNSEHDAKQFESKYNVKVF